MKIYVLVGRLGQYIHCGRSGFLTDCTHLLSRSLRRKKVPFQLAKVLARRQSISQIYSTEDLGPDWKFCITFIFKTFFLPKVNYLL